MQVPAQNSRPSIFTCTRSGEENSNRQILSGMTSWIAGLPQQLMRSSPFPWMNLIVLMKFLVTGTTIRTTMARINYSGKPWQQKNDGKPWQNRNNKWQNRDNKPWQNKDIKVMAKQQEQR